MSIAARRVRMRNVLEHASVAAVAALFAYGCGGGAGDGGIIDPLPVTAVEINAPKTTLELGEAVKFTATARDKNGVAVAGSRISWSVSPQSVAHVDTTGLVTALAAGAATVTAVAGGISGTKGVTVSDTGIPFVTTVAMTGNAFSPFNVTIHVTGTVNWEFPADEHDVVFVARPGAPPNIPVTTRATVARTFSTIGVFPYDCRVHPGMAGQVTVVQ